MGQNGKISPIPIPIAGSLLYATAIIKSGSQYPTPDANNVKATAQDSGYEAYLATDPAKSLTGAQSGNEWLSVNPGTTNMRFHIDLGSAKIITRIYYHNHHDAGSNTNRGVKTFTIWGSNNAAAFAELTYATNTNWTQLTPSQNTFDQHVAADASDPKYITITNAVAYRYYALKFADNWGGLYYMGLRRIELQIPSDTPSKWDKLAIGTNGQALKSNGTVPYWG